MSDLYRNLLENETREKEVYAERMLLLRKMVTSDDPVSIVKATSYYNQMFGNSKAEGKAKSLIFDPFAVSANQGWKPDYGGIDANILRKIAETPYVRSVIDTRVDQIADYAEPQQDKYATGFLVRRIGTTGDKIAEKDKKIVEEITKLILSCGSDYKKKGERSKEWVKDITFDAFLRKFFYDSFVLDKGTFEVVETVGGWIDEFFATDSATMFIAESFEDSEYRYNEQTRKVAKQRGQYPSYVQVVNNEIVADYYPWELCFATRNPSTQLIKNGYGNPELRSLIQVVTNLLNADTYNANFFKVGSAPKGILRISGDVPQKALEEFKQQWQNQMAGVLNSHRLPVMNAEKAEFINTQVKNRDMEYSLYHQMLVRLLCVMFKMSPREVGLDSGGSNMFHSENASEEIQYSKDKGLKPALKMAQRKMNKMIVQRDYPEFEMVFVGMDAETPEKELEREVKEVQYLTTYNEIAKRRGGKEMPWGDMPLNPVALQLQQMQMMGNPESDQFMDQGDDENANPFEQQTEDESPIKKSFDEYCKWLNTLDEFKD